MYIAVIDYMKLQLSWNGHDYCNILLAITIKLRYVYCKDTSHGITSKLRCILLIYITLNYNQADIHVAKL